MNFFFFEVTPFCSVHQCRMGYESRILEAKNYPKHVMSIVIDGSDNGEYGLPHFARKVNTSCQLCSRLWNGHRWCCCSPDQQRCCVCCLTAGA